MPKKYEVVLCLQKADFKKEIDVELYYHEIEIIFWLAGGFTYTEIAEKVKRKQINTHHIIDGLYDKTGYHCRIHFCDWAFEMKILLKENFETRINHEMIQAWQKSAKEYTQSEKNKPYTKTKKNVRVDM